MKNVKVCPHCHQTMMIYRRGIRKFMLFCIRKLFFKYGYESIKTRDLEPIAAMNSNFELLAHWGLIESVEGSRWKITRRGVDFILGKIEIHKYVWIYDNKLQPKPEDEENPMIRVWDICPQEISKEIVLRDARSYPVEEEKQINLFEQERI